MPYTLQARIGNIMAFVLLLLPCMLAASLACALNEETTQTRLTYRLAPKVPRQEISPLIYGVASGRKDLLTDLGATCNRWGGNTSSRYNWKLGNAWNTGKDWFFQNVNVRDNAWEVFLRDCERAGVTAVVNLPLLGWVAKDTASYSFSGRKYGAQQAFGPYRTDAGNGVLMDGTPLSGNDPLDVAVYCGPECVGEWVSTMVRKFPRMFQEKRIILALGNEPMLWDITHRDVHPEPASCDEVLDRYVALAREVRKAAPNVPIAGPELWGWPAYTQSALDRKTKSSRDQRVHGGKPFLTWFLEALRRHENETGQRLIDYLTVHYYPQTPHVVSADITEEVCRLRMESTRSLYDPAYVDPSWINDKVQLIPRLKQWVAGTYPGLKIGVTEYNWGAEKDMSGALAVADVLGIFGREGLDLANYWSQPPTGKPAGWAFCLYTNVDGKGTRFGNLAMEVMPQGSSLLEQAVSVYGAIDESSGTWTVIAVNRSNEQADFDFRFDGLESSLGQGYVLQGRGLAIEPLKMPVRVFNSGCSVSLAPLAAYHFRFPSPSVKN